jgi:hypothetical protein
MVGLDEGLDDDDLLQKSRKKHSKGALYSRECYLNTMTWRHFPLNIYIQNKIDARGNRQTAKRFCKLLQIPVCF